MLNSREAWCWRGSGWSVAAGEAGREGCAEEGAECQQSSCPVEWQGQHHKQGSGKRCWSEWAGEWQGLSSFFQKLSPLPSLISLWKLLGCCIKTGPWPNIKFWLKISSLIYYIFFKLKINFWYILSSVDKPMSPLTGIEYIFITSKTSACISPASSTQKHLCSFSLLLPAYSIKSLSYKVHAWVTFWEIVKLFLSSD